MNDVTPPPGDSADRVADALYCYATSRRKAGDQILRKIEGTSVPDGPPLDPELLEQKAFKFISARKWTDALSIYLLLLLTQRSDRYWWGIGKLLWRIAHQPEIETYVAACGPRISKHLTLRLGLRCESLDAKAAKVGYSSVTGNEHSVKLGEGGEVRKIYERISETLDVETAARESTLFTHIDAASLAAPRYYGFSISGPLVSSYYEFAEGRHVDENEWWIIEEQLIFKFWSAEPHAALFAESSVNVDIARKTIGKFADRIAQVDLNNEFKPEELKLVKDKISARIDKIIRVIERTPKFVWHLDFHRGNVLVDASGKATVLDWERFSLEPIGFGWRPFAGEGQFDEINIDALRAVRPLPADLTARDLMLMASLWGFYNATERGNAKLSALWLRRLAEYSNFLD